MDQRFAMTDKTKGHHGLSAFVIPMDAAGVTIEKHLDKMGQRATDTSAIRAPGRRRALLEQARRRGRWFKIAMHTLDFTRPG